MNGCVDMSIEEWLLAHEKTDDVSEYEIIELLLICSGNRAKAHETANELFDKFGSLEGILNADFEDLTDIKHISEYTATFLKLQYSILRHCNKQKLKKQKNAEGYENVINMFMPVFSKLDKERMYMISVNSRGRLKKLRNLTDGTADCVVLPLRVVVDAAIKDGAVKIFLAHNHPNGNAYPSMEDVNFTMHAKEQLAGIGVELAEHYVICDDKYYPILQAVSVRGK